jgi:ubiquinone biosynthesis protein UbiJ
MFSSFTNQATNALGTAAMERITLLLNHVLRSEPVATARLTPHAGRSIQVVWTGWPSVLPAPPLVAFLVTPAGMLEWCEDQPPLDADLRLTVDARNPAKMAMQWLGGQRPEVGIDGDAAFAADISWVMQNVRWDIQDDLARIVGDGPAHELAKFGQMLSSGLQKTLRMVSGAVGKMRRPEGAASADAPAGSRYDEFRRNDATRFDA